MRGMRFLGLFCTLATAAAGPTLRATDGALETPPSAASSSQTSTLTDQAAGDAALSSGARRLEREGDAFAGGKHVAASITTETTLERAARTGATKLCETLISTMAPEDVNIANDFGTSPLHLAAANGHVGCLSLLLAAGAQANAVESDGSTPLLLASREGQLDTVKALIAWKGTRIGKVNYPATNVNRQDLYGSGPLHVAAARGKLEVVKLLLAAGADKDLATLNRNETPLYVAARSNQYHVVTRLCSAGADKAKGDRNGWSPLHVAAHEGAIAAMASLITAGAKINQRAADGQTPLHVASGGGVLASVEKLVRVVAPGSGLRANLALVDSEGYTALARAAAAGRREVLAFFLALDYGAAGADVQSNGGANLGVDVPTLKGETPLHLAAGNGHCATALALLLADPRGRATLDVPNNRKESALFAAAAAGELACVAELLGAGAALDTQNRDRETALFAAATNDRAEVVAQLAGAGAALDLTDARGATPLFSASRRNRPAAASALIAAGCRLNDATDAEGETAVYVAAKLGYAPVLAVLVTAVGSGVAARTVDLERPNQHGETPLFAAARNGHKDAAQVLVNAGAKEFKASAKGRELAALLDQLGVVSNGNGPFGDVEKASWTVPPNLRPPQPRIKETVVPLGGKKNGGTKKQATSSSSSSSSEDEAADEDGRRSLLVDNPLLAGETPLHRAARTGTLAVLRKLLASATPADLAVGNPTQNGWTALHSASASGEVGAVKLLLQAGADVNSADLRGDTALHVACRGSFDPRAVEAAAAAAEAATEAATAAPTYPAGLAAVVGLLAGWPGSRVNALNDFGSAPLHVASAGGHLAALAALARAGAELDVATLHRRETALWVAARADVVTSAAALVALGANPDLGDREGWRPLHVAVAKRSARSLQVLVDGRKAFDGRADYDAAAKDGATPVLLAARLGFAPETAILVRGTSSHKRVKPDLNKADLKGVTPLIAAAAGGFLDVVEVLLGAGAALDARSAAGETALFQAASKGHVAVVERLLATRGHYKADFDIPDALGDAPILAAARNGHKEVCQALVNAGAKEFKASAKGQELAALLEKMGVASNGNGPFGAKEKASWTVAPNLRPSKT